MQVHCATNKSYENQQHTRNEIELTFGCITIRFTIVSGVKQEDL